MTESSIIVAPDLRIQAGDNELSTKIYELEQAIEGVAEQDVRAMIGDDEYTEDEMRAMVVGRKMELTNALDLAAILFRGECITEIQRDNLVQYHPGQYANLEEMAADNGVSKTELSKTLNLVQVVFPRLIELGYNIPEVWANIGKSNLGEMVPVLRQLITGEESSSDRVRTAVENLLNDVAASIMANPDANPEVEMTDEQYRDEAIRLLVQDGQELSFRALRARLGGTGDGETNADTTGDAPVMDQTPATSVEDASQNEDNIVFTGFRISDNEAVVISIVNRDNYDTFEQRFGLPEAIQLPTDPAQRQAELAQIPQVRRLLDFMSGI